MNEKLKIEAENDEELAVFINGEKAILNKEERIKIGLKLLAYNVHQVNPFKPGVDPVQPIGKRFFGAEWYSLFLGAGFNFVKKENIFLATKQSLVELVLEISRALTTKRQNNYDTGREELI